MPSNTPDAYKPCIAKPALKTPSNVKDGRPALGLARLRARVFRQLLMQAEHRGSASLANVHCVALPALPYTTRHLAKVANALPGVRSGLRASSKTETLSKLT